MAAIKRTIEQGDTPAGRAFNLFVQLLIVVSLVSFALQTLPNLSPTLVVILDIVEWSTVVLFTIEYAMRLLVATHWFQYVFSFFGIVDLMAIAPFYLGLGVDLRSIRVLRFLRLFRIFKLVRYSAAIQRYHCALSIAKEELILFLVVAAILLYVTSVGIYYCESEAQPEKFGNFFLCLWWAVATLSTVGYGDAYPITVGGKIFTALILLIGLGVISVPAGLLASALAKARQLEDEEKQATYSQKPEVSGE